MSAPCLRSGCRCDEPCDRYLAEHGGPSGFACDGCGARDTELCCCLEFADECEAERWAGIEAEQNQQHQRGQS